MLLKTERRGGGGGASSRYRRGYWRGGAGGEALDREEEARGGVGVGGLRHATGAVMGVVVVIHVLRSRKNAYISARNPQGHATMAPDVRHCRRRW